MFLLYEKSVDTQECITFMSSKLQEKFQNAIEGARAVYTYSRRGFTSVAEKGQQLEKCIASRE